MAVGVTSQMDAAENKKREEIEHGLAKFGRQMLETRIILKKEVGLRRKLGSIAFNHIHASGEELKERLLEVFSEQRNGVSQEEIIEELKKLRLMV